MNRRNIIFILVEITVLLAILSWGLSKIAVQYTWVMQPLALFMGFILAQRVAAIYNRDLRKSFLFLSFFLLLYMPTNIPQQVIWIPLLNAVGSTVFLIIINLLQAAAYAMLITSCVYTVRVIEIKRLNTTGWVVMGILSALCAYIIYEGVAGAVNIFANSPTDAISLMVIRVFDMAIILMLVPVLLLKLQYSQAKAQESLTFSMIMGGIIISLFSTYIFELFGNSIADISSQFVQKGSWLDVVYIFG